MEEKEGRDIPAPADLPIRRSLSIRIYNPLYGYPLCRSRIENPDTQSNRITNPIGRKMNTKGKMKDI